MATKKPWYKQPFVIIAVIVGLLVVLLLIASADRPDQNSQSSAPLPTDASAHDALDESSVNRERLRDLVKKRSAAVDTTNLSNQINAVISQNPDIVFGVAIKDLSTDATYNYGHQEAMTAASVSKVLTAVDYLKQVELGKRSLDSIMVDGNSAQYDMELMIVYSDNAAWEVLNEDLGYQQMQDYAHGIGLTSYAYSNNTMSSPDTAKLFGDLYERLLVNDSHTQLLLSYMERANYRDLIIPAVPAGDTVYHKAGELYAHLNDAAIITNSHDTVVLSIYTESLGSYSKSRLASLMQQITTATVGTFGLD